jgi:RimJ/RimL family protein N-acetyltransferase
VFDAWFDSLLQRGGSLALVMEDGRVAGSSSFSNYREEGAGALEIGSTFLARDLWGGPVNRAMKQVMLRHAFVHVALVEFLIGEDNVRSRRAVEKIGARLTDRVVVMHAQGRDIAHLVYEIARRNFNGELPAR